MALRTTVLVISAAVLVFQILLTRLFSLVFSYHYTFLGVSVALCGLGLGGALVTLPKAERWGTEARFAGLFGLGICVTLAAILAFPDVPSAVLPACVAGLAFVAAGAYFALVFRHGGDGIASLYAASLVGSALGCVVVFPLLRLLGAPAAVAATALAVAAASIGAAKLSRQRDGCVALTVVSIALIAVLTPWILPEARVGANSGKEFAEARLNYTPTIDASRWSGFARTDLVSVAEIDGEKILYTDGAAPAPILRWSGDADEMPNFDDFVGAIPFRMMSVHRALVLGSGGGRDVLVALAHGVGEVTAVEVNPDMVSLVHEQADYAGNIYRRPEVELEVREARSYLGSTDRRWDLVFISLPRSQRSANLAGYQLVENYLMSSEAMDEYFRHLGEEGLLSIVAYGEADMLKLFGMTLRRLVREQGLSEAEAMRRIAIFRQPNELGVMRYLFVARARAFDEADLRAVGRLHGRRGIELQLWSRGPGERAVETGSLIESLCVQVTGVGIEGWITELGRIQNVDLEPPIDEMPFFYKWIPGVPPELMRMLWGSLALVVAVGGWAFWWASGRDVGWGGVAAWLGYFGLLGGGFALIEIALVHKTSFFLGAPAYSLAVTLGALLLGGGAGSAVSGRLERWPWVAPVAVSVVATLCWLGLSPLLGAALGWSFAGRAALVAVVAGSMGFVMGMPFPLGLARLVRGGVERIPWAWAANGVASVTGSVVAVVIAMSWGFSAALLVAAGVYSLAAVAARGW